MGSDQCQRRVKDRSHEDEDGVKIGSKDNFFKF